MAQSEEAKNKGFTKAYFLASRKRGLTVQNAFQSKPPIVWRKLLERNHLWYRFDRNCPRSDPKIKTSEIWRISEACEFYRRGGSLGGKSVESVEPTFYQRNSKRSTAACNAKQTAKTCYIVRLWVQTGGEYRKAGWSPEILPQYGAFIKRRWVTGRSHAARTHTLFYILSQMYSTFITLATCSTGVYVHIA